MENNERYEYTYTAPTEAERKMAEEIRRRYRPAKNGATQIVRLKKLDEKVRSIPMIVALTLGIIGTLMFGGGMAIVLEKLFKYYLIIGVSLSAIGLIPIALAYPVYGKVLRRCKKKYSGEILRLSEEILNEAEEQ